LTQRDSGSSKRISKLLGRRECRLENSTFRYNRMKDKLKVLEKGIHRRHEEELPSWADRFFPVGTEKGEDSRTS
jgi:hypothetical protein